MITFTGDDGEELVSAITLEVDNIDSNHWRAIVVSDDRRSPRCSPGEVVVTIGARSAAANVEVSDDRKALSLVALGPFGTRGDLRSSVT